MKILCENTTGSNEARVLRDLVVDLINVHCNTYQPLNAVNPLRALGHPLQLLYISCMINFLVLSRSFIPRSFVPVRLHV